MQPTLQSTLNTIPLEAASLSNELAAYRNTLPKESHNTVLQTLSDMHNLKLSLEKTAQGENQKFFSEPTRE